MLTILRRRYSNDNYTATPNGDNSGYYCRIILSFCQRWR